MSFESDKYRIEVSERAEEEIWKQYNWYEEELEGLGVRFISHLDTMFDSIKMNPYIFPKKYKHYHQAPMKVFPFLAIYVVEGEEVVIESIFHTSQDPKKKHKGLPMPKKLTF